MLTKDNNHREAIEEAGKLFENFGLTPMQGRIMAFFLVTDSPERTFDEIVNYFAASKSSISNSLNYLLQSKFIDYKTFSTDRKRYFFISDEFFIIYFEKILENVIELKEYTFKALSMRSPDYPGINQKILKWIENANVFQSVLKNTLSELKSEAV